MFIRFTARAFSKLMSIYVFSYFPFGFEGRIWNLIVSVPDQCLFLYFERIDQFHIRSLHALVKAKSIRTAASGYR